MGRGAPFPIPWWAVFGGKTVYRPHTFIQMPESRYYPNLDELKDPMRLEFVIRSLFDRLYAAENKIRDLERQLQSQTQVQRKP
jgi:hypothetical protein